MEWFTVKYRQPNGAITEAEFEVADKSALFKLLAEKKISAINVRDGRVGNGKKKSKGRKISANGAPYGLFVGLARSIVFGVVAVLVVGIGVLLFVPVPKSADKGALPSHDKVVHVNSEHRIVITNEKPEIVETKVSSLSPAWQQYYDGRDTNKWKVVYNPVTKKEYISRIVKTGLKNAPPPLYKTHALNILDAIAFKPINSLMPNVRIDDRYMRSFQEALTEKIVIDPNDPADIRERKAQMIDLMADLKNRIRNGEDIKKLISDSLAERNKIASLKRAMQEERSNMKRNGVPQEEINEFVAACNKRLEECGATPIISKKLMMERIQNSNESLQD